VKLIQSEQEFAKMKENQEKSEIGAKSNDAKRKAQIGAQIQAIILGHLSIIF
jgi:hypothetical protein